MAHHVNKHFDASHTLHHLGHTGYHEASPSSAHLGKRFPIGMMSSFDRSVNYTRVRIKTGSAPSQHPLMPKAKTDLDKSARAMLVTNNV